MHKLPIPPALLDTHLSGALDALMKTLKCVSADETLWPKQSKKDFLSWVSFHIPYSGYFVTFAASRVTNVVSDAHPLPRQKSSLQVSRGVICAPHGETASLARILAMTIHTALPLVSSI